MEVERLELLTALAVRVTVGVRVKLLPDGDGLTARESELDVPGVDAC